MDSILDQTWMDKVYLGDTAGLTKVGSRAKCITGGERGHRGRGVQSRGKNTAQEAGL